MSTYDNGCQATPEWASDRRPCPLPDCDLCREHEATGFGVYPLPKGAVLGEN